MTEPIILSSSGISAYKKCKKSFDLGYIKALEPKKKEEKEDVMNWGIDFHKWAEYNTKLRHDNLEKVDEPIVDDFIKQVYNAWWANRGEKLDASKRIVLGAESPLYVPLNVIDPARPDSKVWLRCTFDEIYVTPENWVVGFDYKTFKTQQPVDVDLDFQGRIYTKVLSLLFPQYNVKFIYERIRQDLPTTHGGKWPIDKCYEPIEKEFDPDELNTLWDETQYVVAEMFTTSKFGIYYRVGDTMTCKMCRYKELCKADLAKNLDDGTIDLLATRRPPMEIPASLLE